MKPTSETQLLCLRLCVDMCWLSHVSICETETEPQNITQPALRQTGDKDRRKKMLIGCEGYSRGDFWNCSMHRSRVDLGWYSKRLAADPCTSWLSKRTTHVHHPPQRTFLGAEFFHAPRQSTLWPTLCRLGPQFCHILLQLWIILVHLGVVIKALVSSWSIRWHYRAEGGNPGKVLRDKLMRTYYHLSGQWTKMKNLNLRRWWCSV